MPQKTLDEAAKDLLAALDDALSAAVVFIKLYVESTAGADDIYESIVSLQEVYDRINELTGDSNER